MSIDLRDVSFKFKNGNLAINHVNLEISKGIYGLLGENGAGKTTLMRVLTTILKPTTGKITIDGIIYGENNYPEIQKKIGYLPQELNLYPNLTVQESLMYMGELSDIPKKICRDRIDYYLDKTSLKEHQNKKNRQLSGGMKRRVGLIQALITEPDFLIVDEPTTGLDPEERVRIRNLLVDFSEGRTILFSTHVVEDLAATCNLLSIMKKGSFIYSGTVRELLDETKGHIWICHVKNEEQARVLEKTYRVSSKQYDGDGMQVKIISDSKPKIDCIAIEVSLEDAYMYISSKG